MFLDLTIQQRIENGLGIGVLRADAPGQLGANSVNARLKLARVAHGVDKECNGFDSNLQQELLAWGKASSGKDADSAGRAIDQSSLSELS